MLNKRIELEKSGKVNKNKEGDRKLTYSITVSLNFVYSTTTNYSRYKEENYLN